MPTTVYFATNRVLRGPADQLASYGDSVVAPSDYDAVTEVPEGLSFAQDDYYTSDCTIVNDSSGLPGSPQVAMGAWWSYDACVKTTDVPHLIELADGHVLKLRVETYYETGQEECNDSGRGGDESGVITMRWQYLQ